MLIRFDGCRTRGSREVVERHEERDRRRVIGYEVLQEEEVDVTLEVLEQCEELPVADERVSHGAAVAKVMQTDALQRQVETVADLRVDPALFVDGAHTVDPPTWKDQPA